MNGVQIRVGDLLYAIGKRWKMILAFVLVGCGFGAALSGISYVQGNYTNYKIDYIEMKLKTNCIRNQCLNLLSNI